HLDDAVASRAPVQLGGAGGAGPRRDQPVGLAMAHDLHIDRAVLGARRRLARPHVADLDRGLGRGREADPGGGRERRARECSAPAIPGYHGCASYTGVSRREAAAPLELFRLGARIEERGHAMPRFKPPTPEDSSDAALLAAAAAGEEAAFIELYRR